MGRKYVLSVQVRNEAGQMVLAGPKKGEEGSMYKKWAKHNKASIMATGAQLVQPGGIFACTPWCTVSVHKQGTSLLLAWGKA
jgi:hypothetical protein